MAEQAEAAAAPDAERWADGAAWVDGGYVPINEARISLLDWGLTHADAVYDVVSVWNGAFFRLEAHLARFERSTRLLRLDPGRTRAEIAEILEGCVARSGLRDSYVAMVCTRGRPTRRGSRDPRDCENRFFAYAIPFIWVFPPEIAERGARIHIPRDIRRIPQDSVDPTAKNYHWGDFTQGLFAAKDRGFDSALLLDHQDRVTEGPGFNVFMVKDGQVATPDAGALLGITRATVLELAGREGYETAERPIPLETLLEADEVLVVTTGGGVCPVTEIDGRLFGNGAPGPVARRLGEAYWRARQDEGFLQPVDYAAGEANE